MSSTAACVQPFDTTIHVLATNAVDAAFSLDLQNCVGSADFVFNNTTQHANPVSWLWTFLPSNQTSTLENPTISFSAEDTLTVKLLVIDSNGCKDSSSQLVFINIIDSTWAASSNFCPGDSVALNPGGSANYSYNWQSAPNDPNLVATDPNPMVAPAVPTTYSVTIENGLCSTTQTILITPNPAASVTASADVSSCDGAAVSISASGSPNITLLWSTNPNFTPIIDTGAVITVLPLPNGYYYVKAQNAAGCTALDSVRVDNHQVDIAYNPEWQLCLPMAVPLNIQNMDVGDTLNYVWTPTLPNVANPLVDPLVSTTYTAVVTNQFGCLDTAVIQVGITNLSVTASIIGLDTIFLGDTATLIAQVSGGSQYTFQWYPEDEMYPPTDGPQVKVKPSETTTYTVVVTDIPSNCSAEATVRLFVSPVVCDSPFIFIPTVFTPNNDGNNDLFLVRATQLTELHFMVFNRWGEKMYETFDVNHSGWDGMAWQAGYTGFLRLVCSRHLCRR
ncbi:MAG: gliding motility-associated C-terminal domain-containing protein [Lewinellaceae bacterium]|nr:gliding motility-associated C-terminal domain-containing protein [Lewinellaceae bacterium]